VHGNRDLGVALALLGCDLDATATSFEFADLGEQKLKNIEGRRSWAIGRIIP
jgi:hypothetical protein